MSEEPIKITTKSHVSYDATFYTGALLKAWAKAYCKRLPEGTQALVSAGASGCSIAAAMLTIKTDLKHKHIHPANRTSHRGVNKCVSGAQLHKENVVFVDDFVDTGMTVRKALEQFKRSYFNATVVAILVGSSYNRDKAKALAEELGIPIMFANKQRTIYPKKCLIPKQNLAS